MNTTLRNILVISAKNAVNAVITNAALKALLPGLINFTTKAGLWNVGKVALSVILAREALVWGPSLIRWTQKDANP